MCRSCMRRPLSPHMARLAFLSHGGQGKSTLAAAFVRAGYALLSDDVLALERLGGQVVGNPAYPALRLWPDEAQFFLGQIEPLERVYPHMEKRRAPIGPDGFGSFAAHPAPMACIYVPVRYPANEVNALVEITPLNPAAAVIELIRYSFLSKLVHAMGWQPQRLRFLTDLAAAIPVCRLRYPSGLDFLPQVREAILQDLAARCV